jgi:membrane-bound metal-dependent hydrolase YbcI (DUF457 family)
MFLGHYAAALLAKRAVPAAPLGAFVAAALLPDLVWPIFLLLGWERVEIAPGATAFTPLAFVHYPWSHSLVAVVGWAFAAGAAARLRRRPLAVAGALAVLVVSHWVLDFITHRPDLPLYPGGTVAGLGLWRSVPGTLAVELALFVVAAWLALRTAPSPLYRESGRTAAPQPRRGGDGSAWPVAARRVGGLARSAAPRRG